MDPVIRNAQERLRELQAELREVTRFIELYRRFSGEGTGQQKLNFSEPEPEQNEPESKTDTLSPPSGVREQTTYTPPSRGLSREMLRPHLRAAILEAGRPLSRGQLLKAMDDRGVPVGGTYNRPKNMGTIMWRLRDEFISLDNFGYWPKSEVYPPAKYDPAGTGQEPGEGK